MRNFMAVSLTAALLALGGCSQGPPQSLRGPGPKVGQVYHDEMQMKMTDGKITLTVGGESMTG